MSFFLLKMVYENFYFWALSQTLIRFIRKIDLNFIIGCCSNFDELCSLIDIIEKTNFLRKSGVMYESPEGTGDGANFVYFDLKPHHLVDEATAKR